jgi:hypothetical protein
LLTLGASKYLAKTKVGRLNLGLTGALNSYNAADASTAALLSAQGKNPLPCEAYLRFIAPRMNMHLGHSGMGHGTMKM